MYGRTPGCVVGVVGGSRPWGSGWAIDEDEMLRDNVFAPRVFAEQVETDLSSLPLSLFWGDDEECADANGVETNCMILR